MRAFAVLKQLLVQGVKVLLCLFFVRKDFDNLLPFHHLFHEAFFHSQRSLLRHHILCAAAANFFNDHTHRKGTNEHNQRQPKAVPKHHRNRENQSQGVAEQVRHTLPNDLSYGIRIVGVVTHDIAMRVRIKVFDGKPLHFCEHLFTDMVQHPLRHHRHNAGVDKRCQHHHRIDNNHHDNQANQLSCHFRVHTARLQSRTDNVIHNLLHVNGRYQPACRAKHKASKHRNHAGFVIFEQHLHQPSKRTFLNRTFRGRHPPTAHRSLRHRRVFLSYRCHYALPPSAVSELSPAEPFVCAS